MNTVASLSVSSCAGSSSPLAKILLYLPSPYKAGDQTRSKMLSLLLQQALHQDIYVKK